MKEVFVAVLAIAGTACASNPQEIAAVSARAGEDRIRSACQGEWPDDYYMQEHCIATQAQGYRTVQAFIEEHDIHEGSAGPAARILTRCEREWERGERGDGGIDWYMVGHCVETQWPAYQRLHPDE